MGKIFVINLISFILNIYFLIRTSASSSSTTNQPLKFNTSNNTSNKINIDPAFIRQALFHPTNNSTNPVQFQVKL